MPRILVVDDSLVDRQLAGGLLRKDPELEIQFAGNGVEALAQMAQQVPHLVLTDLMMPEMDGLELVARIVSHFPRVPVILMTGQGSEETAVEALSAGAASYVPKTALSRLLLETVHHVLEMAHDEGRHADLMECMVDTECRFELGNNSALIPPLINFLHRNIRAVGLCDERSAVRVCVALEEALTNAIFHGNLEMSSDLRDDNTSEYMRLAEQRRESQPYLERSVRVDVHVSRHQARFVVRDEGPGFDPTDVPNCTDPSNLDRASGRGILLMKTFMDDVTFNELGNEVTLTLSAAALSSQPS